MKKIYLVFIAFLSFSAFGQSQWDSTYYGNGKAGFGGTLGQSSLKIQFETDSVRFTFKKGPGALNDAVVLYLQSDVSSPDPDEPGYSSTANFTDDGDGLRRAISGYHSGSGRSVLTFANGFMPNAAIAFSSDFVGTFMLKENGAHQFLFDAHLRPSGDKNAVEYTFAIPFNDGESDSFTSALKAASQNPDEFRFLVTYISETGYRSNEFIGDAGPAADPGFNDYVSTTYASGFAPNNDDHKRVFYGNNKNGFGGAVGEGSVAITVKGDSTFFTLRKGAGDLNDLVVVYAQGNVPGHPTGISSTANFTDFSSAFTRAISGFDGTNRSVLSFAPKFKPDVVFVFDKNSAMMYELTENGPHVFAGNMSLQVTQKSNGDTYYKVGFKSFDGIPTTEVIEKFLDDLGLLVNYVRADGYRSNEFIGDPGPDDIPGWGSYNSVTFIGDKDPSPVTLLSFTGANHKDAINLQWKTSQESNISGYEILRSADGKDFSKIGWVVANNLDVEQLYAFQDAQPLSGNNFYKLGIIGMDGKTEFSKIIVLKVNAAQGFKAYTTSSNRILKLEVLSNTNGNIQLEVSNAVGQRVFQTSLKSNSSNQYEVNMNKTLSVGAYSISITIDGQKISKMILVK